MSTKNIWIINHYAFPYGYGFHTRQHTIAKMLNNLGYKVTIFASSFNHLKTKEVQIEDIYKEEIHDNIKYIWINTKEYQGNGFGRIKNIFEFSKNLNKIYKKFYNKPDIVWVSSPQPFSIYNGIKIKNYFKSKFIFEERDIWPLTLQILNGVSKYNPLSIIFRYLQLQAYKHSDLIVTPLENLKEFVEQSGFKNKKIVYIPQPFVKFEIEEFKIDLPKDKFIVGYVGSIGHSNSVMNLIKAANLLKAREDIYFVMVGDGPQLDELKKFVKEKKILNIKFFGKLEKKQAMYVLSQCNILYKGHPDIELYNYGLSAVKLNEYMYSNKPIVHAVNLKSDSVVKSSCGLNILPEKEEELKNAILKLKEDDNLYNKCSNNGRQYVEENFMEDRIEEKLKMIMNRL
ncbi:glycosyltransferase family 4 protein [Aliarcobacter butzleri]|uniref:glycosyltransferase family 4 protein n=1 Tax=Aliarcobacter butzleri TaxID=28197 RepID=UPI0021B2BBF8|nr:glycosyltransferase family 4 protein [Aliarcobacter butzleri]MCT7590672.1 glycosyltransferase family 4 protein [Aliarcobacter butzleri]